ncbi:glutamate racemase [Leptospira fainei serovar Hurstbridge str. BUT 6]|uniref:Glutamate racemase n=1 Tax=Leptospira fainei serovar Hurstbridge str. BUT 6 TaxID=1193011 RepID=S3V718_9LEPT|nr:glutamate racemase [Leptospira fainei]EPG76449.1 glutamate racemase [Leptospira fainei serovar Hurstbridge str. BUT 6]
MENQDGTPIKIGVMDSGMGGLSVLRMLLSLPYRAHYVYYGDLKNAPYGERHTDEVLALTRDVCRELLSRQVSAILLACNTATSAAASELRAELPIPVFGMEPAIKPALLTHPDERIALLATSVTHREEKLRNLKLSLSAEERIVHLNCDGLATLVDLGKFKEAEIFLRKILEPVKLEGIRTLVLGCTHYVFLKGLLLSVYPEAILHDGNEGTMRHLIRSLQLERFPGTSSFELFFSGREKETDAYLLGKRLLDENE